MKIFFISLFLIFFMISCDSNKKLTSHFKSRKTVILKKQSSHFIQEISFLFIIDTSSSMAPFNNKLAENINLFLEPIFTNYPHYNYNFAITTMTPSKWFSTGPEGANWPLFLKSNIRDCGDIDPSLFIHQASDVGRYFSYSVNDLQTYSIENLVCILSHNIQHAMGFDSSAESFFQSITYIVKKSHFDFKSHFFGKDKLLVLFFISDAWQGVDYNKKLLAGVPSPDKIISDDILNLLQSVMGSRSQNIRSYAVALDDRRRDQCGTERGGKLPTSYPFHLYRFIKKTNGFRISLCDAKWGNQLTDVFHSVSKVFHASDLYLDEVPKLDTLEVFLNNKKIPKSAKAGWRFSPETLSIKLAPDFDFMPYILDEKGQSIETNEFTIKYIPLNIELLF